MRSTKRLIILHILLTVGFTCTLFARDIRACSLFCIDKGNNLVVGRNYDWPYGYGLVIVNKRNQLKTAFTYYQENRTGLASWKSKYGSITFNQYGRENVFSGMNEAGLVVSELWLNETQYPVNDSRPSISVDQYVQYLLDNIQNVSEIITSDSLIRVRPTTDGFTKIHFFAIDSSGNGVSIDFLNGQMVYHTGADLPVKAITNNTYSDSITYFNRGIAPSPSDTSSLARFYRAASMARDYDASRSGSAIDYSFQILEGVHQSSTKFRVIFDINNRLIYFKSLDNPNTRYLNLNSFDFSCNTAARVLDINTPYSGDITDRFMDNNWQMNEDLIVRAWADLGYINIPLPAIQIISRYPETFVCTEVAPDSFPPIITNAQNKGTKKLFIDGANLERTPRVYLTVAGSSEIEITSAIKWSSSTGLLIKGSLQMSTGRNIIVRVVTDKGSAAYTFTAR